jgi:fumarylacetoacetase
MALPREAWRATRRAVADLLDGTNSRLRNDAALRARVLVPQASVRLHLPFFVRAFTDFYSSRAHATNVGTMFRGAERALPPNWLHMPIAYNGRASTVVVSGTPVRRPLGQIMAADADGPLVAPTSRLDMEVELGTVIGAPSPMGRPLSTEEADAIVFGHCLLNDWSARDVQTFEYQPLGPFQSKAFATTVSPWIVPADALAPFRVPPPGRAVPLLPYLREDVPRNLDLAIEATLAPEGRAPTVICRTNARHLYYSPAQQIAHHTLSGCAMETGDLLGSGTISGPEPESRGCLLERTWNGRDPVAVDGGTRTFLQDGETVTITACAEGPVRIGFGACAGTILPAPDVPG